MDLRGLIREGRLSEARAALVEKVKSAPADTGSRTLLFQVLVLLGERDKARSHLDMISTQDPGLLSGVQVFNQLIAAEKEREAVFDLEKSPSFLPETPGYFETYYGAVKRLFANDIKGADRLFSEAAGDIPSVKGTVNGDTFLGFSDTDSVLSPFLEAFVHDRYVWVPIASIRELTVTQPKTLTDLIWIQANITTWEGMTVGCFLPVLYPGSCSHENEQIKLGRMADWISLGGSHYRGAGQHVYSIGKKEMAVLEVREVVFTYQGLNKQERGLKQ